MVKSVLFFVVFVLEVDLELHESPAFDRGNQLEAVLAKDQVVPRVVPPVVVAAAGCTASPSVRSCTMSGCRSTSMVGGNSRRTFDPPVFSSVFEDPDTNTSMRWRGMEKKSRPSGDLVRQ